MKIYCCLAALLFTTSAWADITGKVVKVTDGDTVTIEARGEEYRVRLTGIDAPERRQDFGSESTQHLQSLIANQIVTVISTKTDSYGRLLGKVVLKNVDINLVMVTDGYAWWYKQYQKDHALIDRFLYQHAEEEARGARKGLWAGKPVAPWDYRRL